LPYCAHCGSYVPQVSFVPCASCGNPTNGAPSRPGGAIRKSGKQPVIIGIVIGLVLLVPFIGILAAIAIPNFLTAMNRSKQKRTMADMRTIGTVLEAYATDNRVYPAADSLDALRPLVVPKYIKQLPTLDGWTHPFRYAPRENGYSLVSAGSDGVFNQAPAEYTKGTTNKFDCDIVLSNGEFVVYPEGVQQGGQ
jgi:type II secretory pathway pseudopilin PulG